MNKNVKAGRVAAVIFLIALLCIVYSTALYDLQVIKGGDYYVQSVNTVVTYRTIPARRGSLLDRFGNVLASDRSCYDLTLNRSALLNSGRSSEILLRLTETAKQWGVEYLDTLPVSADAPFVYTEADETQSWRMEEYFKFFEYKTSPEAPELMAFLREHYEIPAGFTDAEARAVAGLRWELEMRLIVGYIPSYVFAADVSTDFIAAVSENGLTGVETVTSFKREYSTAFGAQVLGYVGKINAEEYEKYSALGYSPDAVIGRSGAESAFESYLHGTDGAAYVTTSADGAVVDIEYITEPVNGQNVVLTLSLPLQAASENSLAETIAGLNASRGEDEEKIAAAAAVAIEVGTGEILVSASYPSYDPSRLAEIMSDLLSDENAPLFNRATQGIYEPGSTFKIVTSIAALQEGAITLSTQIYDGGKYTVYEDYQPACWIYPGSHGLLDVVHAVKESCNYFFFTVGEALGIEPLTRYAASFGLGQPTGVELYEELGTLASETTKKEYTGEPWYPADTLQASIGQSLSQFTPLQIASYCATIANNGTRLSAHLLKSVKTFDFSRTSLINRGSVLSVVEAESAYFDAVQEGMRLVASDGSASPVFGGLDFTAAAKTGTAQQGEDLANNAIFICYAPVEDPQVAVAVVVEKGASGNAIASIAADILSSYFEGEAGLHELTPSGELIG